LDYAKSLKQRPPGLSPGKQMLSPGPSVEDEDALDRRKVVSILGLVVKIKISFYFFCDYEDFI
jgi:hypothetical protein